MCEASKGKEQHGSKTCPICGGEKVIEGTCTCDNEWRGTQGTDAWDDCKCTPKITCPKCGGTGVITD